jgi:hypothetical protein
MSDLGVMIRNCMWEMRGSNLGRGIGFPYPPQKNVKVLSRSYKGCSFQNFFYFSIKAGLLHTLLASEFSRQLPSEQR